MSARNIVDGVHLIQQANVKSWLIEGGGGGPLARPRAPATRPPGPHSNHSVNPLTRSVRSNPTEGAHHA